MTGGSAGLGVEIVRVLAYGGAKVYMASLDYDEGLKTKDRLLR